MSWINDAKLSTKLITAFALCAFITLGVGLGMLLSISRAKRLIQS